MSASFQADCSESVDPEQLKGTGLHSEDDDQLRFCPLLVKGPKRKCTRQICCTKLLEDCHCPIERDSDKFHPADWCSIMTANSAFAVRSLLFPEVQPSRLPVVAYSGVFTMPKADFQASLGPHIGETCSAHLCMHKRG